MAQLRRNLDGWLIYLVVYSTRCRQDDWQIVENHDVIFLSFSSLTSHLADFAIFSLFFPSCAYSYSTNDKGRLSKEDIERMVSEAEKYKAEDEEAAGRISAKNGLESYTYSLRNSVEGDLKDKIPEADREKILAAVKETSEWLDASQEASKTEYEEKQKELEAIANPVMAAAYGAAGGAPGGMPGMPGAGGMPGGAGFPGGAQKSEDIDVEEVD